MRGIDHLVIDVEDLDTGRAFYERLGFTMTPRAQHPFGTGNSLAQLQGGFLEVLSVTEPENVPEAEPGHFSFGAFNREFLASRVDQGGGMSMLVLRTDDADADRALWSAAGLTTYAPFGFERLARQPDGSDVTMGFSLAFATDARMPDAVWFSCQHRHAPEHFYKPKFQAHANTATHIAAAGLVADDPWSLADFFEGLVGAGAIGRTDDGLEVQLAEATLRVLSPDALDARFDGLMPPVDPSSPHFFGCAVACADLDAARRCLVGAEIPFRDTGDRVWVAPEHASGSLIGFVSVD